MRCWIVCRKRSYRGSLMRPIDHRFWTSEPLVTRLWAEGELKITTITSRPHDISEGRKDLDATK